MLRFKHLALLGAVFALLALKAQVEAAKATTTCAPNDDDDDDRNGNDTLCVNFQDLRATIEKDVLVNLIQSHYQCNPKFRKALSYYNTARFQELAQQLQQSEAYRVMLEELRLAGVDTSDIENIIDIFACLELPAPLPDKSCDCKALRGHTFIGDLLAAMPHQVVHEYTAANRAKHTNFALFTDTVNSSGFQTRMRSNLRKRDLARPLRILRHNGWDVPELLRGAMSILSW